MRYLESSPKSPQMSRCAHRLERCLLVTCPSLFGLPGGSVSQIVTLIDPMNTYMHDSISVEGREVEGAPITTPSNNELVCFMASRDVIDIPNIREKDNFIDTTF